MRIIRKIGRLRGLALVLAAAVTAGLFLAACEKSRGGNANSVPTQPGDKRSDATTRQATAASQPATGRTIDIAETQRGELVPHNLLE